MQLLTHNHIPETTVQISYESEFRALCIIQRLQRGAHLHRLVSVQWMTKQAGTLLLLACPSSTLNMLAHTVMRWREPLCRPPWMDTLSKLAVGAALVYGLQQLFFKEAPKQAPKIPGSDEGGWTESGAPLLIREDATWCRVGRRLEQADCCKVGFRGFGIWPGFEHQQTISVLHPAILLCNCCKAASLPKTLPACLLVHESC